MTPSLKSLIRHATLAIGVSILCACSSNKTGEPADVKVSVIRGTSDGTPTMVKTTVMTEKVRVKDVNYDAREITLDDPDGDEETFKVGPGVVNFNQIHDNDMVTAKYTAKLAISVSKDTGQPDTLVEGKIELPPEGDKPGIVATRTSQITANVTAIDHDTRVVTVVGPRGNTLTFQVAPQAKGLENVNVGDQVVARYTEAVEIRVTGS